MIEWTRAPRIHLLVSDVSLRAVGTISSDDR